MEQNVVIHLGFERAQLKHSFLHPSTGPTQKELRTRQIGDQHVTLTSDNRQCGIHPQQGGFLFVSSRFRQSHPLITTRALKSQRQSSPVIISSLEDQGTTGAPQRQLLLKEEGAALNTPICPSKLNPIKFLLFPWEEVSEGAEEGQVCYTNRNACT